MRLILIVTLMIGSLSLQAQEHFSGLFVKDSLPTYHYSDALIIGEFNHLDDSLSKVGYVLSDWNLRAGNELTARGIWRPLKKGETAHLAAKDTEHWPAFVKVKRSMVKKGYLMTNIQYYTGMLGEGHYMAKWTKDSTIHKVWKFSSFEHLKSKVLAMKKDNFVLQEIEVGLDENRSPVFLALFYKKEFLAHFSYCYEAKDLQTFQKEILRRIKSGFYLSDVEVYRVKEETHYVGIFEKGKRQSVFIGNLSEEDFYSEWEEMEKKGYVLVDLEW